MAITTIITSRGSDGLTFARNGRSVQIALSSLQYQGAGDKVNFWAEEKEGLRGNGVLPALSIPISEISINTVSGFSTAEAICSVLDALLFSSKKVQIVDLTGISTDSRFRVLKQLVTRPANVTPVIANGVLTDVSTLISKFSNANKAPGYPLMISDFRIQTNDTGVAGKTFRLHVYDSVVTPTAYNTVFAIDDANAGKRRGKIEATFALSGNLTKVASNLLDAIIIAPAGTDLYFKLECVEGFTPSANSTWFEIQLGVVQTN